MSSTRNHECLVAREDQYFLPSETVYVTLSNGKRHRVSFDFDAPVLMIEKAPPAPFIPRYSMCAATMDMFEPFTGMVVNVKDVIRREMALNKDIAASNMDEFLAALHRRVPLPGHTIGFVGGRRLIYAGQCHPFGDDDSMSLHVVQVGVKPELEERFVSTLAIANAMDESKRYWTSKRNLYRVVSGEASSSNNNHPHADVARRFTVTSHKGSSPYDSLILLKLVGAVSKKATKITFINTDDVEKLTNQFKRVEDNIDWSLSGGGGGAEERREVE